MSKITQIAFISLTITLLTSLLVLCAFFRERRATVAQVVVVVILVLLVHQETKDHLAQTEMMVPAESQVRREQRVQLDQQELL